MPTRRRPTFRLLLTCLALGLAMTIAIALGSAVVFPSRANLDALHIQFLVEMKEAVADPSTERERWEAWSRSPFLGRPLGQTVPPGPPRACVEPRPGGAVVINHRYSMVENTFANPNFPGSRDVPYEPWMYHYHDIRGWPFPALGIPWERAVDAPVIGSGKSWPRIRVPMHPMWKGLLADTGTFAGAWAVVLVVIPAVRRARWRRNGKCEACGYELASLTVCPECGATAASVSAGCARTACEQAVAPGEQAR